MMMYSTSTPYHYDRVPLRKKVEARSFTRRTPRERGRGIRFSPRHYLVMRLIRCLAFREDQTAATVAIGAPRSD